MSSVCPCGIACLTREVVVFLFCLHAFVPLLVRTCIHSDLMLQVFHKGFMSLCLLT